ncbi:hypothetical protein [Rhodoferax aquaticus]|uniref:Uncharacterized protein n=1 Tax=Rhodoferax aquaticus TaxID=2527691 RepID=A0A515ENJ9_9BURK|nr:hypothetical protein [Rhodoferax aquaticus]QDL54253.1 hypothetical protein EXZ61_08795 [Rhodoferax aquaticus]
MLTVSDADRDANGVKTKLKLSADRHLQRVVTAGGWGDHSMYLFHFKDGESTSGLLDAVDEMLRSNTPQLAFS